MGVGVMILGIFFGDIGLFGWVVFFVLILLFMFVNIR